MITRTLSAVWIGMAFSSQVSAQTVRDVPQGHWAHAAVLEVVAHGVMTAPGGKFDGARKVTRAELAVILERLALSLEKRPWTRGGVHPIPYTKEDNHWRTRPVTRYDLAFTIDRIAHYVSQGLPTERNKVYGKSIAMPSPVDIKTLPRSSKAYTSLKYLATRRMLFPDSFLLKPGDTRPVTGEQAAQAIAELCIGLNDRWTDEPQNRPEIAPPPGNDGAKTPSGGH